MENLSPDHKLSMTALQIMINHVYLPPKLPQADDYSAVNDLNLSTAVLDALKSFCREQRDDQKFSATLQAAIRMVDHMISAAPHGILLDNVAEAQMNSMEHDDVLAFNVKAQNAALLIRRHHSEYTFEAFEISCQNANVTGTKGRLERVFPQEAIVISSTVMDDLTFRLPFLEMLAKMAKTTPVDAYRVSRKAAKDLPEVRDVIDPRYFTELLFGILRGIGIPAEIPRILKRTQDEVLWSSTFSCWRRSPLWTVIRVALQTTFMRRIGDSHGYVLYKAFMVHFMSRLLVGATMYEMSSDLLHSMHRKLLRRLNKLSTMDTIESYATLTGDSKWGLSIKGAISGSYEVLRIRWDRLESATDPFKTQSGWNISGLSLQDDTELQMKSLRPLINNLIQPSLPLSKPNNSGISCSARIPLTPLSLPNASLLVRSTGDARRILLCDIETWVRNSLVDWRNYNLSQASVCLDIATLINAYAEAAADYYVDNQEGLSRMFLTIIELWVCLDRIATRHEPLLLDYPTGFSKSLFDPLLLPLKSQMIRLAAVENYLSSRDQRCRADCESIFNSFGGRNSLPVRYFDSSENYRLLQQTIEQKAAAVRKQRLDQLEKDCRQYKDLMDKANNASHDQITRRRWDPHSGETESYKENACPNCQKCRWTDMAAEMKIARHEWPLPSRLTEAKTVVFELMCPQTISVWRDTTYFVLVDVFTSSENTARNVPVTGNYGLELYDALQCHFTSGQNRIVIASSAKPIHVSHYRLQPISDATKESICVEHAMRYDFHDSRTSKAAHKFIGYDNIREQCSQPILDESYKPLQAWVDDTSHVPNEVIAKQSECPLELSAHEYLSFGHLRSGHCLQWHNIARALIDGSLNFNHEAVATLVSQAAWQAGPCCLEDDQIMRASHGILNDKSFCIDIQNALQELLSNTRENWQGVMSVHVLITLTCRILSLAPDKDIKEKCLAILSEARSVTFEWTRKLKKKLSACFAQEERKQWIEVSLEVALCCYNTFALDLPDIETLLTSQDLLATMTECMITISELRPSSTINLPRHMRRSLDRFSTTAQITQEALCKEIIHNSSGLDKSITALWGSYSPCTPWKVAASGPSEWVMTKTAETIGSTSVPVLFNLLTGDLLVNGSPLTRLPPAYETNDSYKRLFSEMYITVIPSTMRGMRYESRNSVFEHQIHFLLDGSALVICATKKDEIFRILPTDVLRGDFPPAFIKNYSHWLNLTTMELEFRSLDSPWFTAQSNWKIKHLGSPVNTMSSNGLLHIDMHSPTARAIYNVLSPIEIPDHIHVSYCPASRIVHVHLRRLQLDFFGNNRGALECRQRRNMEVDSDQSCGTFTGVRNKLILRSNKDSLRCIVVPSGKVTPSVQGNHIEIQILTGSSDEVGYFYYELDLSLCRLKDDNSLKSCLFRTLLHAASSHCLPDRFTGKTGTEQAIMNLKDASTLSFRVLAVDEIEILMLVARLTPRRVYYPQHMKDMQEVTWDQSLPPLSQHEGFHRLVSTIFECARTQKIFYDTQGLPDEGRFGEPALLARAEIRNSVFRGLDFGYEQYTHVHDKVYHEKKKPKEPAICGLASLVSTWSRALSPPTALLGMIEGWALPLNGDNASIEMKTLGYDSDWKYTCEAMSESFCQLLSMLQEAQPGLHKYRVAMSLTTLTYSDKNSRSLCEALLGFATLPQLQTLPMPHHGKYNLEEGYKPTKGVLKSLINNAAKDFSRCPEASLPALYSGEEHWDIADGRRRRLHKNAVAAKTTQLVDHLLGQWPTTTVNITERDTFATHFNLNRITTSANVKFSHWTRNKQFKAFISSAQDILDQYRTAAQITTPYEIPRQTRISHDSRIFINWGLVFSGEPPRIDLTNMPDLSLFLTRDSSTRDCNRVKKLVDRGRSSCVGAYETQYNKDMLRSLEHLQTTKPESRLDSEKESLLREVLAKACTGAKDQVDAAFRAIRDATVRPNCWADSLAVSTSIWPRLQPINLLQQLLRTETLEPRWKDVILQYGLLLTKWQYYMRLASLPVGSAEFIKELKNAGHAGWEPRQFPEWVLFEIENNLLIRPEQAEVAKEMLDPSCGSNCVMQLNMGEGKSSVIAPIVAATLANGTHLPRMIVLPSLFAQMFHLLRQKLGGLLGHRIVGIPFSRSTPMSVSSAQAIYDMYGKLLQGKCIILCQPEHILSYDLMGIEKSCDNDQSLLAMTLVKTQRWIDENTRDILDESDEILNVKFELIYTMGKQSPIDSSPQRWDVIASVLRKLRQRLRSDAASGKLNEGLSFRDTRIDGLPHLQVLEPADGHSLMKRVAFDLITDGGVQGLPLLSLVPSERQSLLDYILDPKVSAPNSSASLQRIFASSEKRSILLLLKGLFGHGVLLFVFQYKRWRVNYGHDFSRSLLAVPYRAKDLPASRAEFSHPDATILLTCLSYYYKGLTDDQLFQCLEELLRSDDPYGEYASWTSEINDIPDAFRALSGVNLKDRMQCITELFPRIRSSKSVVDFFMSCLVFPKEMKEFPKKLSSSGWDIAQVKRHPTTGFSGTNDSRYLLPLSVEQFDIPDQVHTNATVLECLLLQHNTYQVIPGRGDAESLLDLVVSAQQEIRVILDVGALVLEWRNDEMARNWLNRVPSSQIEGVVYFDDNDEIIVLTRDGRVQSLQESPMQQQMDACLVYLDEAHTRGTDLKLPSDYRAAATLGLGLSKDRLVQACMRMRKLAHGQSVMLCAPIEIERKIRQHAKKLNGLAIDVQDVLLWSIQNTHHYTKKCVPLWATQGMRHQRRKVVWTGVGNSEVLLEAESKTLEDWYGVVEDQGNPNWLQSYGQDVLSERSGEVNKIQLKMREFETSSIDDAALHEEQERELSPECEQQRQREFPPTTEPAKHSLHRDIVRMVQTGTLDTSSSALIPAFQALKVTKMAQVFDLSTWPVGLWTTEDFTRTVKAVATDKQDIFIRAPQWLLRCPRSGTCVVISPFEANELFSRVRKGCMLSLHIYTPRVRDSTGTPRTVRLLRRVENLQFCKVSSHQVVQDIAQSIAFTGNQATKIQLNLFAGQLFFDSKDMYEATCCFLGLAFRGSCNGVTISPDGFIDDLCDRTRYAQSMADGCKMCNSPVDLLRKLVKCRRKGQGFKNSHMGLLLDGDLVEVGKLLE